MKSIPERQCKVCGQVKFIFEFHREKTRYDGISLRCKECVKSRQKTKNNRYFKKKYEPRKVLLMEVFKTNEIVIDIEITRDELKKVFEGECAEVLVQSLCDEKNVRVRLYCTNSPCKEDGAWCCRFMNPICH